MSGGAGALAIETRTVVPPARLCGAARHLARGDGDHRIVLARHVDAAFHYLEAGIAQQTLQYYRLVVMQVLEGEPSRRKRFGRCCGCG